MKINELTGENEREIKSWEKILGGIVVLFLVVIFFYSLIVSPVDQTGFEDTGGFCYGAGTWDC